MKQQSPHFYFEVQSLLISGGLLDWFSMRGVRSMSVSVASFPLVPSLLALTQLDSTLFQLFSITTKHHINVHRGIMGKLSKVL